MIQLITSRAEFPGWSDRPAFFVGSGIGIVGLSQVEIVFIIHICVKLGRLRAGNVNVDKIPTSDKYLTIPQL